MKWFLNKYDQTETLVFSYINVNVLTPIGKLYRDIQFEYNFNVSVWSKYDSMSISKRSNLSQIHIFIEKSFAYPLIDNSVRSVFLIFLPKNNVVPSLFHL